MPAQCKLSTKNTIVDTLALEWWSPSTQEVKPISVGQGYGAGDLLDPMAQYSGWLVGTFDYDMVTNIIRRVKLSADLYGLLINQSAGFEHTHREYSLFVVQNGKLKKVWGGHEGNGPTWSTVMIFKNAKTTSEELIYINGGQFSISDDKSLLDSLDITHLSWSPESNELIVSQDILVGIYAVVAYPFADKTQARLKLTSNFACYGNKFNILSSKKFKQLGLTSKVVIAAITRFKTIADELSKTLQQCAPELKIVVTAI